MSFYDFTSTVLTIVGYVILVYRIVFELQSPKSSAKKLEKLCTKWIIFTIFLKIEYYVLAVLEIIPLGALSLLVLKLLLFLPENAISHAIYKKIQKKLQKIKLEEYNSAAGVYLSLASKHAVKILMKLIKKVAAFVNSSDIEDIQVDILDVIKILEYKKAAIHVRSQAMASQVNQELNSSDFNISVDEGQPLQKQVEKSPAKKIYQKSAIGNKMSKILADVDVDDTLKINCQLMIVKPDKIKGQKAKYEDVLIEYFLNTQKITITNKNKAIESGTLKQVKWITKNMINIELVLEDARSKIIKLKQKSDVAKFVEPVCMNIEKCRK